MLTKDEVRYYESLEKELRDIVAGLIKSYVVPKSTTKSDTIPARLNKNVTAN